MDRTLALCEGSGVPPRMYLECVADTMGWFCNDRGMEMRANQVFGKNAVDRYHRWLHRKAEREELTPTDAFSRKRDNQLQAESAYIETFATLVLGGVKCKTAKQEAKRAACSVQKDYVRDPKRRMIAICTYLHQLHPVLPDSIVLLPRWSLYELFKTVRILVAP